MNKPREAIEAIITAHLFPANHVVNATGKI
jgi:hypothetical protein